MGYTKIFIDQRWATYRVHIFMCHQITVKSVTSLHPDLALVCMTHIPAFTPSSIKCQKRHQLHPDLALVCMTHIPAFTPSSNKCQKRHQFAPRFGTCMYDPYTSIYTII